MRLTPLGDKIILEAIAEPRQTSSGIFLPDQVQERTQRALVVAVGDGYFLNGELRPLRVSEGDTVLYAKYGGTQIELDGKEYILIAERDILCKVEEGAEVRVMPDTPDTTEAGDVKTNHYSGTWS